MKYKKKISEHNGFRLPSNPEKDKISRYMRRDIERNMRLCTRFMIVLLLLAAFFTGSIFVQEETITKIIFLFITFLCVAGSVSAYRTRWREMEEISAYEQGVFQVLDGKAKDIIGSAELPGMVNIMFCSEHDGEQIGLFRVDRQNLTKETPLILSCITESNSPTGKELYHVFSPYMLEKDINAKDN